MRAHRHGAALLALLLMVACGATRPAAHPAALATVTRAAALLHEPMEGVGTPMPSPPSPPPVASPGPGGAGTPIPPTAPVASRAGFRIQIPGLGVDLPIVEGDGFEPPLYAAAHYPGMKWPGEGDRTFLYAHARPGMFGALFTPAVGQKVLIQVPGGKVLRYTIRSYTASWPVTDTSLLNPVGHEEVVLYTCTSWIYSDPKIVAIAEPD